MNRKDRLAARAKEDLDIPGFLKVADNFIDLANKHNRKVKATQLHMAFLFAAARYNAYVGKKVMEIGDHEPFVEQMVNEYRDMLRQHLADERLGRVVS